MAKKQKTKVSPQADPGDEHVEKVVVKKTSPVVEQPKVQNKKLNPEEGLLKANPGSNSHVTYIPLSAA